MVRTLSVSLLAIGSFTVAGAILHDPYDRVTCAEKETPGLSEAQAGFEFVDIGRREVWGTSDWTVDGFRQFQPPWHKPLYFKNDPRLSFADEGKIVRSPGCSEGEFDTLHAFGREFRLVVRLVSFDHAGRGDSQLRLTRLEKYHELTYLGGRAVDVLYDPDGEQYIAVARTFERNDREFVLPDGWQLETHILAEDFNLSLFGEVTNIRTSNQDSFQGPLSPQDRFPRNR
ncbi:MAG: hypothetical protein AAFO63_07800 [Pseudomonadota bacterium]